MPSKWCPDCEEVVTCSFNPVFCCWCGKHLDGDLLPNSLEECQKVVEQLKANKNLPKMDNIGQVKLF